MMMMIIIIIMMKVRVVDVVRRSLQTLATGSYKLCIDNFYSSYNGSIAIEKE